MSLRQHHRRQQREADRRCLTVSDAWTLNQNRRLPVDHPNLGLRKRKGRPESPRLVFPTRTSTEQAWRYVKLINRAEAIRRVCRWLCTHPGPQSTCPPELFLLGAFLAAEETGWYLRSDICSIINGLDATILHHFGACDNKTLTPISYSAVQRQALRFERAPFKELMAGIMPDHPLHNTEEPEDEDETGADLGLLWFNFSVLLETIPEPVLDKIKAGSVDATAFHTYARTRDFRIQKVVDKAVLRALKETGEIPEDVSLGPDGKLQRCPADLHARGAVQSPNYNTGHTKEHFSGYFVTYLSPSRDYYWAGDPTEITLREHISPYVLNFCVAPATQARGPIARDLTLAAKHALPDFHSVAGDREFSDQRETFVRPLHEQQINVIMDYKKNQLHAKLVTVGKRQQPLYRICGGFYPTWIDEKFLKPPPDSLTKQQRHEWYEALSRFRYSLNNWQDGTAQLGCPQCSGRVVYAKKARVGKFQDGNYPTTAITYAKSDPDWEHPEYCCDGYISVNAEDLDWYQPVPWGTRAHDPIYDWGRSRIENTNSIARNKDGISGKACRAPLTPAHNMAVLALSVVNNIQLADADPAAPPPTDDAPEVELSLFCVAPAFGNPTPNGHPVEDEASPSTGAQLRAPP